MVKKDGMILEKLIFGKGSLSLMPVCIASSLTTLKMLRISLNLQQSYEEMKQMKYFSDNEQ